ncbi:CapA family protein [Clostridium tetani]|uniref:CapA family protein n=1 Tax=Clostridium tetani TaxID=1513 RepID=UPI00100A6048|nr:CapA family protein [Clostridium tetani]RXM70942.1 CapA family protein [Clostridium tetani]
MVKNNKRIGRNVLIFILLGLLMLTGTISYIIYYSVNNEDKLSKVEYGGKIKRDKPKNKKEDSPKKDILSEVLLSFAGDCTIATDSKFAYENSLVHIYNKNGQDPSYFFKNVANIFKEDDLTIVNLENNFTESKDKAKKQFNFKAPPSYAKTLPAGYIDGVDIGNNHIYDYKQKGFDDTINSLKENNINYFGEGFKWIKEVKGVKLGFLGYRGFNDYPKFRTQIENEIKELKNKGCNAVLVSFHWGLESQYYPIKTQKDLAYYAIDKGADLIIGHHPHVLQSIEKYKNAIICYSLGNFCFGGNFNPKDKDTMIFQIKYNFKNREIENYEVKIIPCRISSVTYMNDYCPTPLQGDEKDRVLKKIKDLSPKAYFEISDKFYKVNVK